MVIRIVLSIVFLESLHFQVLNMDDFKMKSFFPGLVFDFNQVWATNRSESTGWADHAGNANNSRGIFTNPTS